MTANLFSDAMSELNEKYIMEAATFQRKSNSNIQKWALRAACILLSIIIAGSAVLTVSVEARAAFFGWLRQQYETFYEYFFEGEASNSEVSQYCLGWMPNGFEFIDFSETESDGTYIYFGPDNKMLTFSYSTATDDIAFFIDIDKHQCEKITIGNYSGELYSATDPTMTNGVVWTNDKDVIFFIFAHAEVEEIIKMAESVAVKK